jgi:cellobiose phosphorylase
MKLPTLTQTFNDGVVNIYSVANIADAGKMPEEGITIKVSALHYEERTVGMSRFYTAMQNQAKVEQMLRVPRIDSVSSQDVAIPNDGNQYKIIQVQYPKDVEPPVMDLSLERLEANYAIS